MNTLKLAGAIAMVAATQATAAEPASAYPSKRITIIIPATPGGAIDITARLIGQKLTDAWDVSVVLVREG